MHLLRRLPLRAHIRVYDKTPPGIEPAIRVDQTKCEGRSDDHSYVLLLVSLKNKVRASTSWIPETG